MRPFRPLCLATLMLALFAAPCAAGAAPSAPADARTVHLDLPDGRPDGFTVDVARDGVLRRVVLRRHSLRAARFSARAHRPGGGFEAVEPLPPATYRGTVVGETGASAFAHLGPDGLTLRVVAEDAPDWQIAPAEADAHVVFEPREALERPVDCPDGVPVPGGSPTFPLGAPAAPQIFPGQHLAQIAFDVDYHYYLLKGSSVQAGIDAVEAIMNEVDFFYARDLRVTYEITHILVRTSQFYFPTGGGSLLELFRNEWNTNQASIVRDMAHLMTNKSGIEFGGLAYVGAVCNSWAYGWSLDSANIVGHELGHNWGSGHCHDLAPCNNMCGGCFYIAPLTKDIKSAYRDTLSCLDDAGAYPDPLPPYAHPEGRTLSRDELALLESETFDVLGNDHDGNLDPLSIAAFDTVSEQGGSVSLSAGTGPGGRDELVYQPPGFVFPGGDRFAYSVGDGTGLSAETQVSIDVPARRLAGYWKLDDGLGTVAADASNLGRHATTEGGPFWGPGRWDGSVRLDGVDDAVLLPALQLRSNTVTLAAWVRRLGSQNAWAGLVFSRDGDTIAGLSVGNAHELRYHWGGTQWQWDSGLVVPDLQWVLVALVLEPQQATLYLYDGSLASAVHIADHPTEEFNGITKIGHDSDSTSRRFRGQVDDVRIYDHALTASEILDLAERGGRAVAPNPLDAGGFVPAVGALSWLAGLEADTHDVYLATDYVTVRDATPASDAFVGNGVATAVPLADAAPDSIYAWRVDEIVGSDVVVGDVWLFRRLDGSGHWRLDEDAGPTAEDADGDKDGSYLNGVLLGEPGATPSSGSSVRLDGADDYVEIPALDLQTEELTIAGWARRAGLQSNYAGLVFSRSGSTVAGISTLVGGDLRYHWNDAYWDWHSGLTLPDDDWAFFALVVRADQATVYLGHDGELVAASNHAAHGIEEFDGTLDLGRDGTTSRYFDGWLDDVRLWRSALSPRDVEALYEQALGVGAGEVPDGGAQPGEPLRLAKTAGAELSLVWAASCLASDTDYAVYEGTLGDFSSHEPASCSTGGATDVEVTPSSGATYYLVVPRSANREGSYGSAGDGSPRPPAAAACLLQQLAPCP